MYVDVLRELFPWRFVFLVRFVEFLSGKKAVSVAAQNRPKAVDEAAKPAKRLTLAQLTIVVRW